jgi:hypothetical protein
MAPFFITNSRMVRSCSPLRFLITESALPHLACRLEVPKQEDGVGQIAHIHWRVDVRSHKTMLGNRH